MKKVIVLALLVVSATSMAGIFKKGTTEYSFSSCEKVRLLVAPLGNEALALVCKKHGKETTYNLKDCAKLIKYSNPFVTGGPVVYVCGKSTFGADREQERRDMRSRMQSRTWADRGDARKRAPGR